ncbi:MAG: hypothetical protein ACR2FN_05520 [Chitinophagaceae bacterium]
MPNSNSDKEGFNSENADEQRDLGAKGGPAAGLGSPDNKHSISTPYNEDLQTQITAKGKKRNQTSTKNRTKGKK